VSREEQRAARVRTDACGVTLSTSANPLAKLTSSLSVGGGGGGGEALRLLSMPPIALSIASIGIFWNMRIIDPLAPPNLSDKALGRWWTPGNCADGLPRRSPACLEAALGIRDRL